MSEHAALTLVAMADQHVAQRTRIDMSLEGLHGASEPRCGFCGCEQTVGR